MGFTYSIIVGRGVWVFERGRTWVGPWAFTMERLIASFMDGSMVRPMDQPRTLATGRPMASFMDQPMGYATCASW